MLLRCSIAFALLLQTFFLQAQISTSNADLEGALTVSLNKLYHFPASPKGYGSIQEFEKDASRSPLYFKEERNSVWLTLEMPVSGTLSFEIMPKSIADDYDWMLFNYTAELANQLKEGSAKLLRSNNSRNDESIHGKTGLKDNYTNLFESPGPGKSYSRSLQVVKGQKLALIIDNIYNFGDGFDFISILKPMVTTTRMLSGKVRDKSTLNPLAARIICEDDSSGLEINTVMANADGVYNMQIPANRSVNITSQFEGYVFQTLDVKQGSEDVALNFDLVKTSESTKLILFNIHFTPDRDRITPESEPELQRLIDLLKKEADWNVRIVGHTNNNPFADGRYLQKLSFNRAISVKKYLLENGVPEKRISCAGMGGKSPLIVTKDVEEGLKNLRVEVVVSRP